MSEIWWSSRGTRLFAFEQGTGRPVVLLHGGLAAHQACRVFGDPLAARYRVITPDLRGSGRSHFSGTLDWDLLADDIAELCAHEQLRDPVIGGISFGAGVAVRVALRHPELASALLVLHPAYGGTALGLDAVQQAAMRAMDAAGSRAVAEGIGVLLPLFDPLPPAIRDRARALVATYDPASVATSTRFMATMQQPFDRGEDLGAIRSPCLLVPGIDPFHPPDVIAVYRAHIRHCHVIEGDLTDAIVGFLDTQGQTDRVGHLANLHPDRRR